MVDIDYASLRDLTIPPIISKDECIFCYGSLYNDCVSPGEPIHSLNLCLTTFQPVCGRHLSFHSKVIKGYENIEDIYYLNISKIKKPTNVEEAENAEEGSNKKIKLHIIDKSEDDIYDTLWSLVKYNANTLKSDILLRSSDADVPKVTLTKIEQILHSKSQEMADQTSSWELSINSCIHTSNFKVPEGLQTQMVEKCSDCDLVQNLWLCLQCGNVGCGREQVGIQGHSHAKKHYEDFPQHQLAVKLGSLSKISSDIYCYACDDEVKFDHKDIFSEALRKYGIALEVKEANEKTLVELQVEQNMNWDFQMTDSKGDELTRLNPSKEYGCGLINLGNSCYINSVLQCLLNGGAKNYSLDGLGHAFPIDVVYPEHNIKLQLIKLNNAIKLEPEIYPNGIRPKSFKRCVAQSHQEFSSGKQQDALEFLLYFMDILDEKVFKGPGANPNDLLKFLVEDKLKCNDCGKVKYNTQVTSTIQLPLLEDQTPQNIVKRLRDYFVGEQLDFTCPSDDRKCTATKSAGFQTFPGTLVINPIRIKLENWTPVKTSYELIIPGLEDPTDTLDVSEFKSRGFDPANEEHLPDSATEEGAFVPNPASMSQLIEMGFGSNAIQRALYNTGNQETEVAMNWLFQHIDDADLNEPFTPPSDGNLSKSSNQINPTLLEDMVAMGLDPKLCKKALILKNGNINESIEWVFNNMDDDGELQEKAKVSLETSAYGHSDPVPYMLKAVVCHKGNSVQSGHYVAFIRKQVAGEDKWVLYNDEKIVIASQENLDEIKKNGYFYFYSRV